MEAHQSTTAHIKWHIEIVFYSWVHKKLKALKCLDRCHQNIFPLKGGKADCPHISPPNFLHCKS